MKKFSSVTLRIGIVGIGAMLAGVAWSHAAAQIQVRPDGVNVNVQDSNVVFLTFGPLANQRAVEGCWCGDLIPAPGSVGQQCNPAAVFGCLPVRNDLSSTNSAGGFTDIMSIPASVSRRAYQAALDGADSRFFYVRHFISLIGGPDEYVNVTCRLTGGGARAPFSLTDVRLSFAVDKPVLLVSSGEPLPPIKAEIHYNGSGRLKGRWEVVQPGDAPPTQRDLVTEATLPIEDRARQQRYTQISTFNVLLPPDGRYTLAGPDVSRIPTKSEGEYQILLRIEATDEKEGNSDLAAIGLGTGIVHSGGVAGFSLPTLRYFVGGGPDNQLVAGPAAYTPTDRSTLPSNRPVEFTWPESAAAAFYRLEVEAPDNTPVLGAVVPAEVTRYRAPSWLKDKVAGGTARWRLVTLDGKGVSVGETEWLYFKFAPN